MVGWIERTTKMRKGIWCSQIELGCQAEGWFCENNWENGRIIVINMIIFVLVSINMMIYRR